MAKHSYLYNMRRPVSRGDVNRSSFAMEEAGADLIELGIPFSDPDGRRPGDTGCQPESVVRRGNYR